MLAIQHFFRFLACCIGVLAFCSALVLQSEAEEPKVTIEYWIAQPNETSIDNIHSGESNADFRPIESPGAFSQNFDNEIWFRINGLGDDQVLDLGFLAHKVDAFFQKTGSSEFSVLRHGKVRLPQERWTQSNRAHFIFDDRQRGSAIYAKVQSSPDVPVNPEIIPIEKFQTDNNTSLSIHILCLGAAAIMMAFNLSLAGLTREPLFLLNFLAVFFSVVTNLIYTGILPAYIFKDWAPFYLDAVIVSSAIGTTFSLLFMYVYLGGGRADEWLVRKSVWLVLPVIVIPTLLAVAEPVSLLAVFSLVNWLVTVAAFAILIILSMQGHTPSRIMLPTLALVIIPTNVMTISSIYLDRELWIPKEHILEYLIVSEALLFSLIVAYRIRQSRQAAVLAYNQLEITQNQTNRKILESVDAERKRIASDLHDTAGQGLITISNRIVQILKNEKQSQSVDQELSDVSLASKEVLDDIRRISHDLHPATLDFLGLENSIKELFKSLSKGRNLSVDLEWDSKISIADRNKHIQIFRIVQEVVSNIAKHSNGDAVSAKFTNHGSYLGIEISDNGPDVELTAESSIEPSLGKTIINQRITSMAGEWSFGRVSERSVFSATIPI